MTRTAALNPSAQLFCESLAWNIDINWIGRQGIHKLDENRRVVLTLNTGIVADHYLGIKATVVNKTMSGEITSKQFIFDEHLSRQDRADDKKDYPGTATGICYQVISHCGWQWYIAVPKTTAPFCKAIESWIDAWR